MLSEKQRRAKALASKQQGEGGFEEPSGQERRTRIRSGGVVPGPC